MDLHKEYRKYKWFFTKSGKLVIGGKSAEQNDFLLKKIKSQNKDFIVMHTSSPGSPFSLILADKDKIKKSDLEETAIFTASFSRAWKECKQKANIDIFLSSSLTKSKSMKSGTWGVSEVLSRISVNLELALVKQNGILRAVPPQTAKSNNVLLKIVPGKIDKLEMLPKLTLELGGSFSKEEILSALPSG